MATQRPRRDGTGGGRRGGLGRNTGGCKSGGPGHGQGKGQGQGKGRKK